MATFIAGEIVSAAKLNMATVTAVSSNVDDRTFTNTAYADLGSLTGGAGTMGDVSVSVETGTSVCLFLSASVNNSGAAVVRVGFRVSGATTLATADATALILEVSAGTTSNEFSLGAVRLVSGLTPGVNVFELQAKTSTGTARIMAPGLAVLGVI